MINVSRVKHAKYLTIALLMVILTACGGGRATSTTSNSDAANKTAEISWLPPSNYMDNTPLTELSGHNLYINDGSGYKKLTTLDNPGVTSYVVDNLTSGTYSFVVTAFDIQGIESTFSAEVSITI